MQLSKQAQRLELTEPYFYTSPFRKTFLRDYHAEADEFFYVISGTGFARFGGKDHPIEPGDVIFIPTGEDHKLFTEGTTVELLAFLDKPGLDEEFRAWHRAYGEDMPVTIEQLNEIARKHGTVYRTLE